MFTSIETLINKALLLDPKSKSRLKKLQGKHVKIEIRNFTFKFPIELSFDAEGLHISLAKLAVFDAIVHGSSLAFMGLVLTKDPHKAASLGLNFEGNLEVIQTLQALFLDLDIDWEEVLSKFTHDGFAHQVGKFVNNIKQSNQNLFSSLTQNFTDYLQEEARVLPSLGEVQAFYQDVEILRDTVERLEARILRLGKLRENFKKTPEASGKSRKDFKKSQSTLKKRQKPTTKKNKGRGKH